MWQMMKLPILGCVAMQVYGKHKTRFYEYKPGNDRPGVSVDAERIYNNTINGFAVSFHHTINSIPILILLSFHLPGILQPYFGCNASIP